MAEGILKFFTALLEAIGHPPPEVSAVLLVFISVGLVGLLFLLVVIPYRRATRSPEEPKGRLDLGVDLLKEEISRLRADLDNTKTRPEFSTAEKLYFNVKGIANSGLVLSIGLLLWEFFTLRTRLDGAVAWNSLNTAQRTMMQGILARAVDEVGHIMGALALALLVSAVIVLVARLRVGRSLWIINRAFAISLIIALAAFALFIVSASPWKWS